MIAPRVPRDSDRAKKGMIIVAAGFVTAFCCGGCAVAALWWASEAIG